ncbi:MAG: site-specific integrase, partial [Desulfobulbaceae bacterium]|nr:site-specific integrase [Desulfobulbaceae bacterium]
SYPSITLAEVREIHAKALQETERGIDPGIKQKETKSTRKAAPTFTDIIIELWEKELQHKKSCKDTKRLLEHDVLPAWGNRKVADIKRRDIVLLLDSIAERAPITRNRVHGALSRLFNFAGERGIIEDSPCTRIKKLTEKGRTRVLTDDEIMLLWSALDLDNVEIDIYRLSKLALKMILLTGQRPGEVCGMAWAEIVGDTWNIPAERMKGKEAHSVPLTDAILEVIEQARVYSGDSQFVFRSSYKDDSPMLAHGLSKAILRHWQEIGFKEKFTPHDLRRTVRTRLTGLGVSDVVAERVLGHKLQGILAVYNRHGYDDEKREALEKWEKKLRQIVGIEEPEQGKIVQMRRGAI